MVAEPTAYLAARRVDLHAAGGADGSADGGAEWSGRVGEAEWSVSELLLNLVALGRLRRGPFSFSLSILIYTENPYRCNTW